jgi:hypothetical protein
MHESPLRRGRSGEPELGRRAESEARVAGEEAGPASRRRWVVGLLGGWKGKKMGKERETTTRRSYTPRKRRRARARALPDAVVAVS